MMRIFFPQIALGLMLSQSVSAQVESSFGVSNPLVGKTGAASRPSIDAASVNPAQMAEIPRSEAQIIWGASSISYSQRYPGFDAHSSNKQGLSPSLPIPSFAYKPNPRFGIGGILIPFPVNQDIDVKDLPFVILGQENKVDMKGNGKLKAYADIDMGYRVNQRTSFGLNINYISVEADGTLEADSQELASFILAQEKIGIGLGVKTRVGRATIGLSTEAFSAVSGTTDFESGIAGEEDDGETSTRRSSLFNPIRLGLGVDFSERLFVSGDMEYLRVEPGQTRFSVVDFKEKDLDTYDTISLFLGAQYRSNKRLQILGGYFNEPSAVGPGSSDPDGKTGFGFIDIAQNLGNPPAKPVWGLGAGAAYQFDPVKSGRKIRYRMALEGGIVYSETSIGVDEGGEQPGAYLAQRYLFPLKFIYKF